MYETILYEIYIRLKAEVRLHLSLAGYSKVRRRCIAAD